MLPKLCVSRSPTDFASETIQYVQNCSTRNNAITDTVLRVESLSKNFHNIYEFIPNNKPVKFYLDFDYYLQEDEIFDLGVIENVHNLNKYYIKKAFNSKKIEPIIKWASSHGTTIEGKLKYSLRYYITNVLMTKEEQECFIKDMNVRICYDQNEHCNKYCEYLFGMVINKPFDENVYKSGGQLGMQKIRMVYSCKDFIKENQIVMENRPLVLMEDTTFEDTVITACFTPNATRLYFSTEERKVNGIDKENNNSNNTNKFNELLEYSELLDYNEIDDYGKWTKNVWSIRSYGIEYKELARKISKRSIKYEDEAFEKVWNNYIRDDITIASFLYNCKKYNEHQFNKIYRKYNKIDVIPQLIEDIENAQEIKKISPFSGGLSPHADGILAEELSSGVNNRYITIEELDDSYKVAEKISPILKNIMCYCNEKWITFDFTTKLWSIIKKPTHQITTELRKWIDYSNSKTAAKLEKTEDEDERKKLIKINQTYLGYYKKINGAAYINNIIENLSYILKDNNFYKKLDSITYKIAFKNGIYDLKTGKFNKCINYNDYLTKTIPYDYEECNNKDILFVENEMLKIFNNNNIHKNYALSTLGYALTGDSSREQSFWCLLGQKASNGKTTIFEICKNIAPNYFVKLENNIFENSYGSRHKEVATWNGIRVAFVNELSKKTQDEDVLKEIADGNGIRFKVMYGHMDTMPLQFKLFITSNNTIRVSMDNGMKRRLKIMQMDSEFGDFSEDDYKNCKFIKNNNFIDEMSGKYKYAFLALLFKYAKKYVDDGYKLQPYPSEWIQETENVAIQNNKFDEFFYDNFEIDKHGFICKHDVDDILSRYHEKVNLKDELKRMRVEFTYDSQKRGEGEKIKGLWYGFKEIKYDNFIAYTNDENT
jgi:hypothetical protein